VDTGTLGVATAGFSLVAMASRRAGRTGWRRIGDDRWVRRKARARPKPEGGKTDTGKAGTMGWVPPERRCAHQSFELLHLQRAEAAVSGSANALPRLSAFLHSRWMNVNFFGRCWRAEIPSDLFIYYCVSGGTTLERSGPNRPNSNFERAGVQFIGPVSPGQPPRKCAGAKPWAFQSGRRRFGAMETVSVHTTGACAPKARCPQGAGAAERSPRSSSPS
jgi:hypothetical protein